MTLPPPPKFGFCLSRGFASCAAIEGAEGPIRANSSLEIPSGFLVDGPAGFLACDCEGPAVEDAGKERIERTSAAEAAMFLEIIFG